MSRSARYWVECGLAMFSAAMLAVTVAWPDWVEGVFGVDPDAGSGALEWGLVAALLGVTLMFGLLARREYVRRVGHDL